MRLRALAGDLWSLFGAHLLTVAGGLALIPSGSGTIGGAFVVLPLGFATVGVLVAAREPKRTQWPLSGHAGVRMG
jgi:hypothetical protein